MKKHQLEIFEYGDFRLKDANEFSYLYLPLFNEHGILSAITPDLNGDIKLDQHHFALAPVTSEDLVNGLRGRNVFFCVDGDLWSFSGKTPYQKLHPDHVVLSGGLVYQNVVRFNSKFKVSVCSFVPSHDSKSELHKFVYTNTSVNSQEIIITTGIPIFGRSADNIRDHHHVTSLLNTGHVVVDGIINEPSMKFDERGHRSNGATYGVYAKSSLHEHVSHYHPQMQAFVGEGQDLFYPSVPQNNLGSNYQVGDTIKGYEIIGGLQFSKVLIAPNDSIELIVVITISSNRNTNIKEAKKYLDFSEFNRYFNQMTEYWQKDLKATDFHLSDEHQSGWAKWVSLQPTMRRIYGCSFLPHHDYGRGGRGWRDLWQDSIALIFKEPKKVRNDIFGHFAGVRIDGSNATIVGTKPGEFLADRNRIVRIWSDHGAWPLLTVLRYVDRTGDLDFLFSRQTYFKDKFISYTREIDYSYDESLGTQLLDHNNHVYQGSILEHLLLENVIPFFNVGEHGNIRIEDADWNDGMDMAKEKGETVAFTALYAGNLLKLANTLTYLHDQGIKSINVLKEAMILFDTIDSPIDYHNISAKLHILNSYFEAIKRGVSGESVNLPIELLIHDLKAKHDFFYQHLNEQEWMEGPQVDEGWFNGYYDNRSHRLESTDERNIRMTLTGQTFTLMSQMASVPQIAKIIHSVNRHLMDPTIGIPRLNTDFQENTMKMGRFMGFAYGHKENGSMFSHMAVMYAYSLFENDFVEDGRAIIDNIYHYMSEVDKAKILPGIPEYIDSEGRGMYHYLTGSASWMLLTYIEQIFGLKGYFGDLVVQPRLQANDFKAGYEVKINTLINAHLCEIIFKNPDQLDYRQYQIHKVNDKIINAPHFTIKKNEVTEPMTFVIVLGGK